MLVAYSSLDCLYALLNIVLFAYHDIDPYPVADKHCGKAAKKSLSISSYKVSEDMELNTFAQDAIHTGGLHEMIFLKK